MLGCTYSSADTHTLRVTDSTTNDTTADASADYESNRASMPIFESWLRRGDNVLCCYRTAWI